MRSDSPASSPFPAPSVIPPVLAEAPGNRRSQPATRDDLAQRKPGPGHGLRPADDHREGAIESASSRLTKSVPIESGVRRTALRSRRP